MTETAIASQEQEAASEQLPRIYKYALTIAGGPQEVKMPARAEVVRVGVDTIGQLCVWASVVPAMPLTPRAFQIVGTGEIIRRSCAYLGMGIVGAYVLHVLELDPAVLQEAQA